MDVLYGILIAAVSVILTKLLDKKRRVSSTAKPQSIEAETQIDYKGHYQAKYLLTKNEWYEYRKLRDLAAVHGLQVCPKVRLLDIVEPRRGDPDYMKYMGKIKSKHVDFVICDQDLRIKGILELDDNSHSQKDRQDRDSFVDEVLTGVGYKVIRTKSVTETTLDPITASKTTTQ